ncbi:RNA polymerase sigma factor [Longirhabdus pacifica]|uniref:RNA polymerase sigma factor n=1 Tax=Longirhabdus pacifica TaxID=2305227 RepID=UPI001008DEB7|nr:RNA polymerase sigma factor [Longirhabdus pacifica]
MVEPQLIKAAQAGDNEALVQVLRDIESHVYRTAYYLLGNEQDALDISQEALIRIYKKITSYEEKAQFKTWVQRIVTNICIDHFRKKKTTVSMDEHDIVIPTENNVEKELMQDIVTNDVQEAISRLPDTYRTVIVLRYIQDFSYDEIANALDMPLNTVKSYLFRARTKLQTLLHDYEKGGVHG